VKVQASDCQVHLLIQACEYWSKVWWMGLKFYGSEGYLVSTSRLLLAKSEKVIEFMIPTPLIPMVGAN
jgi:hypothetical protein